MGCRFAVWICASGFGMVGRGVRQKALPYIWVGMVWFWMGLDAAVGMRRLGYVLRLAIMVFLGCGWIGIRLDLC